LAVMVKPNTIQLHTVALFLDQAGKHMKKYIVLIILALLTMTGAVLEGLVEGLSPQLVQANGLLTLLSAFALVVWTLKIQTSKFSRK